jgi:hypothetical protein
MLRFLLPALLMVGALLALFAGAFGDWQGVSESWDRWHMAVADLTHGPQTAPVTPPVVAQATPVTPPVVAQATPVAPPVVAQAAPTPNDDAQQAAADHRRQQVAGLQAEMAERTQELASLHADTEKARQQLDALRQQQQAEDASTARRADQVRQAEARVHAQRQRRNGPAVPAPPAFAPAQSGMAVPTLTQLMDAREVLASGRTQDARHLLARAQTQMVFQPVTPEQPDTRGGNRAATAVGEAIRWLDAGDIAMAVQAISRAIDITQSQSEGAGLASPTAAPPYPPPAGYRFVNQP